MLDLNWLSLVWLEFAKLLFVWCGFGRGTAIVLSVRFGAGWFAIAALRVRQYFVGIGIACFELG